MIADPLPRAVIPSACTFYWKKWSKHAVASVPVISSITGIGICLGVAYHWHVVIALVTLSDFYPTVVGNMLALTAPIILTPLIA